MMCYRIKMTFDRPPDFSQRGWKEVLRGAMRETAEYWYREMMPRHFDQSARERYGYQPRRPGYQKAKILAVMRGKAKAGVDLVYSGVTRESVKSPPRIRAFPTRGRLELMVPPYINMKPNRGKGNVRPALGEELTRVTYAEAEELSRVAVHVIAAGLAHTRQAMQPSVHLVANFYAQNEVYTIICE